MTDKPTVTHAGMVCFNRAGQVLICNVKGKPDEWVLPKGHIESSDAGNDYAASREVLEETGIEAFVDCSEPLCVSGFELEIGNGQRIRIWVEWWTGLADKVAAEGERPSKWVSWGRALKLLTYDDQRQVLKRALAFREAQYGFGDENGSGQRT